MTKTNIMIPISSVRKPRSSRARMAKTQTADTTAAINITVVRGQPQVQEIAAEKQVEAQRGAEKFRQVGSQRGQLRGHPQEELRYGGKNVRGSSAAGWLR